MDDGATADFVAAPFRMFLVALLGAALTAACAVVAFGILQGGRRNEIAIALSYIFLPICVMWTWSWLKRLFTLRGVVLSVSPDGLLDRRISDQLVPWFAIKNFAMREHRWIRFLLMDVDPAFDKQWSKSIDARIFEILNRPIGWKGYRISAMGIKANLGEIEIAISKHKLFDRGV